jgi:hypothetical protein
MVEIEDDDLLRLSCLSSLNVSLESHPTEGANFKMEIVAEREIHDFIWEIVNERHFMDNHIDTIVIPKLKDNLLKAMKTDVDMVSMQIPIGKVFFAKSMILNSSGEPYDVETHILRGLASSARQQILRWSRRLGKSFDMKIDMTWHSNFTPPCYSLYYCQSQEVSEEHLDIVEQWYENNPLMYKFSGGIPSGRIKMKWSNKKKYLMNGSKMICRTATQPRKDSGKSPNRLYEDEKALYPITSATEELSIMSRGQPDKEKFARKIASAPGGVGTPFEKLCFDPVLSKFWDIDVLPMCSKITFGADGLPDRFHDIVTPRISQQDLLEEWVELGQDRFMEQFMLYAYSGENRAIPEDVIEAFFDRNMKTRWESTNPCILSYDLGKSISHKSVIMIGEVQPTGAVNIIRIIKFRAGHPFRSRVVRKAKVKGVIDTIPDLAEVYNLTHVIGDATGMGADEPMMDLGEMLREMKYAVPPGNIIPYKWSASSEEFMGKAPLWFNLVLPRMQQGLIRSIFDEDFQFEMRVWRATPSTSGKTTLLKPEKQSYRDDMITAMMQIAFVAFRGKTVRASPSKALPGISDPSIRRTKGQISRIGERRHKVGEPRWRRKRK